MHVKICGITRLEDAELAAELGAWGIGFILWPKSARNADPAVAAGIAPVLRRRLGTGGVCVNQPLDEIERFADTIGLSHIQLHGDEGPSFCAAVAQRTGAKVIKAVRVAHASDLRELQRFHTDYHLLDTAQHGQYGGTGRTWDWSLLTRRKAGIPFLLAGGLNAENVADAIVATRPWAVDVSSGVESEPGVKDPEKLHALFAAVESVHVSG